MWDAWGARAAGLSPWELRALALEELLSVLSCLTRVVGVTGAAEESYRAGLAAAGISDGFGARARAALVRWRRLNGYPASEAVAASLEEVSRALAVGLGVLGAMGWASVFRDAADRAGVKGGFLLRASTALAAW